MREPDPSRPLRIANASAFWGDQPEAAARLLAAAPDVDVVTFDYLAELSLSIMAGARARDPDHGYAHDFLEVVRSLAGYYQAGGRACLVTNAGGLDPERCAEAVRAALVAAGLAALQVAVVIGDDVVAYLRSPEAERDAVFLRNSENAASFAEVRDRIDTANAYLGASAVAAALRAGADLVITGRVADPSLTVGPCLAHYGWDEQAFNRIAGATVAGHLIECGTQVCGGFSTDWLEVPRRDDPGFPIAEVSADGSAVLTKPPGTGGAVTVQTVKEQLLYEIGDPGAYLSPDAIVSLLGVRVEQAGTNRVRVSGAQGRPPPPTYKVSATYRDGYKAHGMLTVYGHAAVRRAHAAGNGLLNRLAHQGIHFRESLIECLGAGACMGLSTVAHDGDALLETVLRISVSDGSRAPVERFTRELAALVTCGPQGVTGYASGRPKVWPIFGYWPCALPRERVHPRWRFVP